VPDRVVFDTNLLISGYLWGGAPRQALEQIREGRWVLLASSQTLDELIHVLGYRKFGLTASEIQPILDDLITLSQVVEVKQTVTVIRNDPTDNIFLGLAGEGRAAFLVSGDRHLLRLKTYRHTNIVTVRRFLDFSRP
jgi:putative PIN family toxin of toxin-antitoxin system